MPAIIDVTEQHSLQQVERQRTDGYEPPRYNSLRSDASFPDISHTCRTNIQPVSFLMGLVDLMAIWRGYYLHDGIGLLEQQLSESVSPCVGVENRSKLTVLATFITP